MIAAVLFWFEVNMFNEKLVVNLFFFSTSSVPKEILFCGFFIPSVVLSTRPWDCKSLPTLLLMCVVVGV